MNKYFTVWLLFVLVWSCAADRSDRLEVLEQELEGMNMDTTSVDATGTDTSPISSMDTTTTSSVNDTNASEFMEKFRIEYGSGEYNFGNLLVPNASGKRPVIMIIHGGCWRSNYDYTLMDSMAVDLTRKGYVTWNIEYRRLGNEGGGWPGTFHDVANALKALIDMSEDYPIDLDNILVTGHSAGGHLALMLGAQSRMATDNPLKVDNLPSIKGIVSLAGITDLVTYLAPNGCGSSVRGLTGGNPDEVPDRYRDGSPINYLPLNIPHVLVNGVDDGIVSIEHIQPYFDKASGFGDDIRLEAIEDAGHFEVIQPGSIAWEPIVAAFDHLVNQ